MSQTHPSIHLSHATRDDIPELVRLGGLAMVNDTHSRLKALVKGYGPRPEDTIRYLSEGGASFYISPMENPQRDVIVARDANGQIMGSVVWAKRGYESVTEENQSLSSEQQGKEKKDQATDSKKIPPMTPLLPETPKNIPNLEVLTNKAMQHHIANLMPPGTRCRFIVSISVAPAYQGRGVGSALMRWGTDQADKERTFCWVSSSMEGREAFEKNGFEEVGRLEVKLDDWAEGYRRPLKYGEEEGSEDEMGEWGTYIWSWLRRG